MSRLIRCQQESSIPETTAQILLDTLSLSETAFSRKEPADGLVPGDGCSSQPIGHQGLDSEWSCFRRGKESRKRTLQRGPQPAPLIRGGGGREGPGAPPLTGETRARWCQTRAVEEPVSSAGDRRSGFGAGRKKKGRPWAPLRVRLSSYSELRLLRWIQLTSADSVRAGRWRRATRCGRSRNRSERSPGWGRGRLPRISSST